MGWNVDARVRECCSRGWVLGDSGSDKSAVTEVKRDRGRKRGKTVVEVGCETRENADT